MILQTRVAPAHLFEDLTHLIVSIINKHLALGSILADSHNAFEVRGFSIPSWSSLSTILLVIEVQ